MPSNLLREPAQDFCWGREVCTAPSLATSQPMYCTSTVQRWGVPPKKTSSNGRLGSFSSLQTSLNTATRPTSTAFLPPSSFHFLDNPHSSTPTHPLFPCCIATRSQVTSPKWPNPSGTSALMSLWLRTSCPTPPRETLLHAIRENLPRADKNPTTAPPKTLPQTMPPSPRTLNNQASTASRKVSLGLPRVSQNKRASPRLNLFPTAY